MRRWLPALAWSRPITVAMLFVACLVVGAVAWSRIPLQMMPSGFEPKFLWVWVNATDGSPRETDEDIVAPIAAQLATVSGIRSVESRAQAGQASFAIEFHGTADMNEAYNAVVDRVERAIPGMSTPIQRYGVWRFNPDDEPVIWAGAAFPPEVTDPYYLMERVIRPQIERVPGVATIELWGVNVRNLEVHYNRDAVGAHGVDLGTLQGRLSTDNFQRPAGRVEERGLIRHVRSLARFNSPDDLANYRVRDGVVLSDIARVGYVGRSDGEVNRVNGRNGAALGVKKESSANAVEVAAGVRAALAALRDDPRAMGTELFIFFDQGALIEDSVDTLTESALFGGVLALVILYVFLREWRMTVLIAASIPFSLVLTVAVIYFRGGSLNLLSLMGLMLAVGMVVDNAIVVIETVYRRRAEGASLEEAAIEGTAEVNLAILLSTLTTMVVFLPMILMSEDGNFAFFMGELGLPVVFALAASLLSALVFAPVATRLVAGARPKPDPRWLKWLSDRYGRMLSWILRFKLDASAMAIGFLLLTIALPLQNVDCAGEAEGNVNDFTVRFTVPAQASLSERSEIVRRFEEVFDQNREKWGVRVYRARLGANDSRGRLFVYLNDEADLPREEVLAQVKKALPNDIPGVSASMGWGDGASNSGRIRLDVYGEDMGTLEALAEEVARRADAAPGVLTAAVEYDGAGSSEVRLVTRREALSRYGLTAATVGRSLQFAMRSNALPAYWDGDREVSVYSLFALEDRTSVEQLRDFVLWSPTLQQSIPVRSVTDVEMGKGPSRIERNNGRTSVGVSIDLEQGTSQEDAWAGIGAQLQDMTLPRGYTWQRGAEADQRAQDDATRNDALLLSVTFVFLLMGVLFESFVLPLSIITTIPMAMMGAFWGLYLTDTPMDVMAGVGLVILIGVIVNNGIVLVDLVTQLRADGIARDLALVEAGKTRLRPILMTALTTVCGLIPMATGSSSFIGIPYAPLGRTVMGGLVVGTLLTLLLVPLLYALLDSARDHALAVFAWVRKPAALALALLWVGEAQAEWPVSYTDALNRALEANPQVAASLARQDQASGSLLSAYAPFDPNWNTGVNWNRRQSKGFFQGFPFDGETSAWTVDSNVGGSLPTGTSWQVGGSLDRNLSTFRTRFGEGLENESLQDAFTAGLDARITQNWLEGHRLSYNLRTVTRAEIAFTAAELAVEQARQEVLAATARAYWAFHYQTELARIATENVASSAEALRVGRLRLENRDLAPVEVTRLEAAWVQARTNEMDAKLNARKAADALLIAMGMAPGQDILPASRPEDEPDAQVILGDALDVAMQQNPGLRSRRAELEAAQQESRDAKHSLLPNLSTTLSAGVGSQESTRDGLEPSAWGAVKGLTGAEAFPNIGVNTQLSVPLGNRAARGEVDRTEATVLLRRTELAEAERQLSADVAAQVATLETSRLRIELAQANVRLAAESLAAEEARFAEGHSLTRDLLAARAELQRVQAEAARALTDQRVAMTELRRLLGVLERD